MNKITIMKGIIFVLFALTLSNNLSAQSKNGIGLDIIGTSEDFKLGLRYEHRISGKHGIKIAASYDGYDGLSPTIGYQYFAVDKEKLKIALGLDYSYVHNEIMENDEIKAGHTLSIPIEVRFKVYKPLWLNIGISPSYDLHDSNKKFEVKDLRLGVLFNF